MTVHCVYVAMKLKNCVRQLIGSNFSQVAGYRDWNVLGSGLSFRANSRMVRRLGFDRTFQIFPRLSVVSLPLILCRTVFDTDNIGN
jgi:hypothetical protein